PSWAREPLLDRRFFPGSRLRLPEIKPLPYSAARNSPLTHEISFIVLFDCALRNFCGSRRDSSVAGISRAEQLRRLDRSQTTRQNWSHQLGSVEGNGSLVAIFAVPLGGSNFPHYICREPTPNPLLSACGWQTGLGSGIEA